ncbi:MAG: Uma2 family endonuclease [Caldilineaceae bacterium]|jgi:Uma2 family endonuclease|nr:Uma2 family endonuclease [Caldilineaceae bacterium]
MAEVIAQEIDEFRPIELDLSHIVTEDDAPVDNLFSERQMRLLAESLYTSWAGPGEDRTFVAMANVGLFFHLHQPPLVPDVLVSLDVVLPPEPWEKQHRSYFVWEYGKPPDVVVEIVSNQKGKELGDKLLDYARLGVAYYIVYDPAQFISKQPLHIYTRQGLHYTEITETWLAEVGVGVTLWEGEYESMTDVWLRWCDPQGVLLATGQEALAEASRQLAIESQRAEQESQRAEQESQRAEQESQRAEQAERRAAALAAKLAALGIDPESD